MQIRMYRVGGPRGSGPLLGLLAVGAGVLILVFGLMLFAALAAAGTVAAAGTLVLRAIRGRTRAAGAALPPEDGWRAALDPRLEIPSDQGTGGDARLAGPGREEG